MKGNFLVAPSILSADFSKLGEEIKAVEEAGADWIHIDVMDGHFVPNLTIGPPVVKSLRRTTKLPLDVHLMIEQPERYIEEFVAAGADYITIHVESTDSPESVLKNIRKLGAKPGITLRPGTEVSEILSLLEWVDLVLVMTVEPGFGGQSFMKDQMKKVTEIRRELDRLGSLALIELDGGVNGETVSLCQGADVLVAGSYVFKRDYREAISFLKESAKG
ncbi:ribulose-phosphate 3-epimerase [Bdellovibrionales bacterium]|nr:ribulose-phosphate 3-epimerase [Bdellovibrionales bacterium]